MKYLTLISVLVASLAVPATAQCMAGGCGASSSSVSQGSSAGVTCGHGYFACCQADGACTCISNQQCGEKLRSDHPGGREVTPTESLGGRVRLTESPDASRVIVTVSDASAPDAIRAAFIVQREGPAAKLPFLEGSRVWFRNSAVIVEGPNQVRAAFRLDFDSGAEKAASVEKAAGICRSFVDKEPKPLSHREFVERTLAHLRR